MSVQVPITFLDLCQRTQQECGVSGNLMSTTVNVTGEHLRIVTWVSSAIMEIQDMHPDYEFLRASVLFTTDTTKVQYTEADAGIATGKLGEWHKHTFRNYLTSAGEQSEIFMNWIPYDQWRDTYFIGAMRAVRTQPIVLTITPSKSLAFGPVAANGYTVVGDYFVCSQPMVNDSDTLSSVLVAAGAPAIQGEMVNKFNMAIIGKAMMSYASYESAPEIYNKGEEWFNRLIRQLASTRLPECVPGGPLA